MECNNFKRCEIKFNMEKYFLSVARRNKVNLRIKLKEKIDLLRSSMKNQLRQSAVNFDFDRD